jgi:hypothetical protein
MLNFKTTQHPRNYILNKNSMVDAVIYPRDFPPEILTVVPVI